MPRATGCTSNLAFDPTKRPYIHHLPDLWRNKHNLWHHLPSILCINSTCYVYTIPPL